MLCFAKILTSSLVEVNTFFIPFLGLGLIWIIDCQDEQLDCTLQNFSWTSFYKRKIMQYLIQKNYTIMTAQEKTT